MGRSSAMRIVGLRGIDNGGLVARECGVIEVGWKSGVALDTLVSIPCPAYGISAVAAAAVAVAVAEGVDIVVAAAVAVDVVVAVVAAGVNGFQVYKGGEAVGGLICVYKGVGGVFWGGSELMF